MSKDDDEMGQPIAGLAALREVTPPPSLVPAVMRRIAEPRPFSLWGWLRRPRRFELRVTPLGLVGAGAFGALCLLVGRMQLSPPAPAVVAAQAPAETGSEVVLVRFVLAAKGAKKVDLVGDFNGWQTDVTTLENVDGEGNFVVTLPLRRGSYEYMFKVDGQWVTDPSAAEMRPDGFGRRNGVLRL